MASLHFSYLRTYTRGAARANQTSRAEFFMSIVDGLKL